MNKANLKAYEIVTEKKNYICIISELQILNQKNL